MNWGAADGERYWRKCRGSEGKGRARHHRLKFSRPPSPSHSPSHPHFLLIFIPWGWGSRVGRREGQAVVKVAGIGGDVVGDALHNMNIDRATELYTHAPVRQSLVAY